MKTLDRIKTGLLALIILLLVVMALTALSGNNFLFEAANPLALFLIFLLLVSNIPGLGQHKVSTFFMGLGFLSLFIGEEWHFLNHYLLGKPPYTYTMRLLFLLPSLFYAINETLFFKYKFKGRSRDLSSIMANSFCVASIGFVLITKTYIRITGEIQRSSEYVPLLFIFIAFYVCMMSIQTFYLVGLEHLRRGTLIATIAMLLYEILDIEYIFSTAIGNAPDNVYIDFAYSLLSFLMALGITIQVRRKYDFPFRTPKYSFWPIRIRSFLGAAGIILAGLLSQTRWLSIAEAMYIIIALAAYLIMSYLIHMSEQNVKQAMMLEEMVAEKTHELQKSNEELIKAKTAAESASKAKSAFLANMSHEIRTPINTILGMDEMILRETSDPTLRKYAINIQRAGTALLDQINDVLDFSRIEAGRMELYLDEYNIGLGISDLVTMIDNRAAAKGLVFNVEVDESIPYILYGDSVRIRQVTLNLLTNAVKYTNEGSVTFSVSYKKLDEETILVQVSVRDTGIGIHEEDIAKLFDAFERIDENKNRSIEGTGLGMNIVWRLLNLMDSTLQVESEYGKGSRFSFAIKQSVIDWTPVGRLDDLIDSLSEGAERYHTSFVAPDARILLVDDTEMNLMVAKGLLKYTELQIDTASDGRQALTLTESRDYDVLLIDHRMPVMDGIEMISRLRADNNNINRNKPCISLTANAVAGSREEYIAAGFNDYLIKPVNGLLLEQALLKYLPEDKVKKTEVKQLPEMQDRDPVLDKLEENGFLDVKDGIEYAGSPDLYKTTLSFFAGTIDERSNEIRKYFDEEDWENYRTKVHALKSSARIIGAQELSNRARSLELAANDGNLSYIRDNTGGVLTFYQSYKTKLANAGIR